MFFFKRKYDNHKIKEKSEFYQRSITRCKCVFQKIFIMNGDYLQTVSQNWLTLR